jgi:hypothetical protein
MGCTLSFGVFEKSEDFGMLSMVLKIPTQFVASGTRST